MSTDSSMKFPAATGTNRDKVQLSVLGLPLYAEIELSRRRRRRMVKCYKKMR